MNHQKRSRKISELTGTPVKAKKMSLSDTPNYEEINNIYILYLLGDFDNMVIEMVKYPYGILDFFKCLQYYLAYRYPKCKNDRDGNYGQIVYEYTKRVS